MPLNFRVSFRALAPDDYKTSIKWRNDDFIWSSVVGRRYYVSEEYERQWVQKRLAGLPGSETFAVCLRENNSYIGNAYINDIDFFNRSCSVGLLIGEPEHRGIGLGFEIVMLLLHHAFLELGLERVSSRQLTPNIASIKTHEKAGFQHEGIARKAVMKSGRLVDLSLMACLREDFLVLWEQYSDN